MSDPPKALDVGQRWIVKSSDSGDARLIEIQIKEVAPGGQYFRAKSHDTLPRYQNFTGSWWAITDCVWVAHLSNEPREPAASKKAEVPPKRKPEKRKRGKR